MANLIATPRQWRNKAILAKSEVTYGTDPVPTGAANWMEGRNVNLTPMDNDKQARNIDLPFMGSAGDIITGSWAKLSFDVALVGSGVAGTAPKWGPLMLASAFAETVEAGVSVAYNLVSSAFGSVTMYMNIDGVVHKLTGSRGSVKCTMNAKATPMLSFSFDSLYVLPVDSALPAVTRTGWQIEEGVNSVNTLAATLNGVDLAFSAFDWDLANKIARVNLPGPQLEVSITDRAPTSSMTVLAPLLATFDPFSLAEAGTTVDFTTTHGSVAGKQVQIDLKVRLTDVGYDNIDGMLAYKLTMEPTPSAGNDEIALTCL